MGQADHSKKLKWKSCVPTSTTHLIDFSLGCAARLRPLFSLLFSDKAFRKKSSLSWIFCNESALSPLCFLLGLPSSVSFAILTWLLLRFCSTGLSSEHDCVLISILNCLTSLSVLLRRDSRWFRTPTHKFWPLTMNSINAYLNEWSFLFEKYNHGVLYFITFIP